MGASFKVTIQNNSAFIITQSSTNLTIQPTTTIVIPANASVTFTFIQTSATTVTVSMENSGTLFAPVGSVSDTAILVFDGTSGNSAQQTGVLISGTNQITGVEDITIDNSIILVETGGGVDTVTLVAPAAVTASWTMTFPIAVGTLGQVLTTDASGITSWETPGAGPDSNFSGYAAAAVVSIVNNTYQTVLIDTTMVTTTGFTGPTAGVVTADATGIYLVSYTAQFESLDQSGGKESSFAARLILQAAEIVGSITECYLPEFNGNLIRPSVSKTIIITMTTTTADALALQVTRTAGTSTGTTRINQCTLTIRRLS